MSSNEMKQTPAVKFTGSDTRGPHHDLPVSAAGRQHGSAAGLEPAVQRAFFSWRKVWTWMCSL